MLRRVVVLGAALLAGVSAPAAAQIPPPSLTTDTNFAFAGVSEYDFGVGSLDTARRVAVDPGLDRHYAVGSTGANIAVVARRGDGSLDTSFDSDGALSLSAGSSANDMVVLANHHLRILGTTNAGDVVIVGLNPDGSLDSGFGTAGVAAFTPGANPVTAGGLALDEATGRLAVTGGTGGDTFAAVRNADGSAAGAVGVLDRGAGLNDAGVDVAWGTGGPVALIQIDPAGTTRSVIHSFAPGGFDTEVTFTNVDDVVPGALMAYGGTLWAAGSVVASGDSDVWLARTAGSAVETRRFDFRGVLFPAPQPVFSQGFDLTVAPGDPDTLVVGGQATTDRGTEWALAAFNGLDGALSALQAADLVVPIASAGGPHGVAGAPGGIVFGAGSVEDPSSHDLSIAMGRALIDAEKRCDLSLAVVTPVELVLRGVAPGTITVKVTNNGLRPCAGRITLPAPWVAGAAALDIGRLIPGASVLRSIDLGYGAALPDDGTLDLTLDSPGDAATGDNLVRLPVVFSFCDLQLSVLDAPPVLGTEGARTYSFSLRNVGTVPCSGAQLLVGAPGRLAAPPKPFTVAPGHSVEDEVDVGVLRGIKSGTRPALSFRTVAVGDVSAANDTAAAAPLVVKVGDTNARTPVKAVLFRGSASGGAARGVSKKTLKVRRVQISVQKAGKECVWLSSDQGDLRTVDKSDAGTCDEPVWLTVDGTAHWALRLKQRLPKGVYTLRSRAVLANGVAEARFSRPDHNLIRFRAR